MDIYQSSCRDWEAWKIKMVMENSWNMENWPKVMEFGYESRNFTNFAPDGTKFVHTCYCHH